jgi:RNA polymerase primary sigma factor
LLKRASQRPTSLDAPIGDDDSSSYAEVISDEHAVNPFDALSEKNLVNQIDDLLGALDEREAKIIEARFGLDGKTPMTLEEVGREFGVTRERIRQLQNIALDKMRKTMRKREEPTAAFLSREAS